MNNGYPAGPQGSRFMGMMNAFRNDRLAFIERLSRDYDDLAHFRLVNRHAYFANHPDTVQQVFVSQAGKFHKTKMLKNSTRLILGRGLLTSDGEFHQRQRRLVQPAFHPHRIDSYADTMVRYTSNMLAGWQHNSIVDMNDEMMKLTLNIVAKTLFDADVSAEADRVGAAITAGMHLTMKRFVSILRFPQWLPTPQNREAQRIANQIEQVVMSIIHERRTSGADKGDLLSMLLLSVDEDGDRMTDQQVRDEAITLFIAGHETTSNALTWTLYLLSQNPAVLSHLIAELDSVLDGRPPTLHDLTRLPFTEAVVKEGMRLYPPAWITSRVAVDDAVIGGYVIKKNSLMLVSPWTMHRNPKFWDKPTDFIPNRFLDGRADALPRYAYFPFGGGPRVCIGNSFAMMEARLVLATIIQHCRVALLPGQTIVPLPLVTLRPRDAMRMRVLLHTTVAAESAPAESLPV